MRGLKIVVVMIVVGVLLFGCSSENTAWETALKSNTIEAYKTFLKKYPEGNHVVEAKAALDKNVWEKTKKVDTVDGYEAYLKLYPEGGYRDKAKSRMQYLRIKEMPILVGVIDGGLTMGFFNGQPSLMLEARELSWCLSFPLEPNDCSVRRDLSHSLWEVVYTNDTVFVDVDNKDGQRIFEDGKTYRVHGNLLDIHILSDAQQNRMFRLGVRVLQAYMIEVVTD